MNRTAFYAPYAPPFPCKVLHFLFLFIAFFSVEIKAKTTEMANKPVFKGHFTPNAVMLADSEIYEPSKFYGDIRTQTDYPVRATVLLNRGAFFADTLNCDQWGSYGFWHFDSTVIARVVPKRATSDWRNGVTILDVAIIGRHLLDVKPITSPYSLICGDVNRDGSLDATDMLLIQRLALRIIPAFPNGDAWRFVLKTHRFADTTNPFFPAFPEIFETRGVYSTTSRLADGSFVALKIGDVNNSVDVPIIRGGAKPFDILVEDMALEKGKMYDIPIRMAPSVSALQFGLNVAKNVAQIENITLGNMPDFNDNNTALFQKEGIVTAAWYNKTPNAWGEKDTFQMMNLRIKALETSRLSQILSFNSIYTEGVAYDVKDAAMPVQLAFSNMKSDVSKAVLLANRPNPFSHETLISFSLLESSIGKLTVCDMLGRVFLTQEKTFLKGINDIPFSVNDPSVSNGIFIVRLQTAAGVTEQKIVLNR
jgi:hypothetical protein